MTALLSVKELKTYLGHGNKVVMAVDDISFNINKGETFCLVGESGSGKSICALSIIQLLPEDISHHPAGQILFQHQNDETEYVDMLTLDEISKRDIRGARIAMIFQEPMTSLNPVMSIGDQIIEALQLHWPEMSYAAARNKTIEVLEQVQISDAEQRIDEYPHRLSGGQRQRVMIAMAMACEPDLLIADEPTTALDVTVQAEILSLMKALQQRTGMSILFITHDFGVVAQMADQVGVMKSGKLVETGTVGNLLGNPKHSYTQQLIAALPENLKKNRLQEQLIKSSEEDKVEKYKEVIPLLELEDLQVYFPIKKGVFRHTVDHVKAVDGIKLDIPQGQILSLVGESGCGKTTLGRAILRLTDTTKGEIRFSGDNLTQLTRKEMQPYRQRIQAIFQDPMSSLNPRLTIATTLIEPMAVHGIGENYDERIERAKQALLNVNLDTDYLWRYPHEFSGGQRQRIGIARALVLQPEFIVCDEVTSALDVSVQAEILQILLNLRDQHNLTLLFITHNISVVEFISDYVAVMRQGKIVEYGNTDAVCSHPQEVYTQELMAAVPRVAF